MDCTIVTIPLNLLPHVAHNYCRVSGLGCRRVSQTKFIETIGPCHEKTRSCDIQFFTLKTTDSNSISHRPTSFPITSSSNQLSLSRLLHKQVCTISTVPSALTHMEKRLFDNRLFLVLPREERNFAFRKTDGKRRVVCVKRNHNSTRISCSIHGEAYPSEEEDPANQGLKTIHPDRRSKPS